ncbi:DNA-binding transcriptional LysR family regulator [Caulobacter ginsengisoli]|uniref:DNA-binding transcriptional LysR family regulator n=1 Tax=Caulobacter ginsengisoli TaxID=400775 RepID=A0ABU0IKV4_9CAUL|nr:LysR family transcriptional regulator [Caulobacter ginsengisoli]MDQ0462589.1 DNA-binding transcriptional LysR family regulator [Caulobacter ginsengisoli]
MTDLNLLTALDVLLADGSVAGAARRLRLSPSAMSRTLARLREATGDPLLVRAGRGLVPTPRALELRAEVGPLVEAARAALGPVQALDLTRLTRTFTIRAREGFVETFGPALIARLAREAPGARLRFLAKPDRSTEPLRTGEVDLETGVVGPATGPEVRAQLLFRDHFVAAVRPGHPLAQDPARYAAGRHVLVSLSGQEGGPIDEALAPAVRDIAVIVSGYAAALALARGADLIATVPGRHTATLREGLITLPLPFETPEIPLSLLWHPRLDADPAHRWLRGCVREVCGAGATS